MDILTAKELAHQKISTLQYEVKETPLETLKTIKFNIPVGCNLFTQKEIAKQNIELDQVGCLGRVAQSVAIVEKHHPGCNVEVAEVVEDYFQAIMLQKLEQDPKRSCDKGFVQELLLYEEPHSVLVVDGTQFDSLSGVFDADNIIHPKILISPSWESICACMLVAQAHLVDDAQGKLEVLTEAHQLCPKLLVVAENIIGAHVMLGNVDDVIGMLDRLLVRRISARALYCSYLLTRETDYRDNLVDAYTEGTLKYLEEGIII